MLLDMPADDPAGQAFCKALNEKMAEQGMYVDFSFVDAPAGKYVEVMPLAVINEVLNADILYFQGNTDTTAAEQGFLEDIKPYVDGSQYLKNIMYAHNTARLENHPYLFGGCPHRPVHPRHPQGLGVSAGHLRSSDGRTHRG